MTDCLPGPVVSVIMPVKNGAAYLDEALESLAGQTFCDFEIVLVDNGSTDETPRIIAGWAGREERLRHFEMPRAGLGECLREAMKRARAPLLARLDADDIAHPKRFEKQVKAMTEDSSIALLGTAVSLIDRRGRKLGLIRNPAGHDALIALLRTAGPFVHSSVMMRADAYERAGGYRKGLKISEDYDLWCRIAEVGKVANLPEILTSYRLHGASVTARRPSQMALAAICVSAAREARLAGKAEPFVNGVPSLRRAMAALGISRHAAGRLIAMRVIRHRIARFYLGLPLPAGVKAFARLAAHRLGIRRPYRALLDLYFQAPPQARGWRP